MGLFNRLNHLQDYSCYVKVLHPSTEDRIRSKHTGRATWKRTNDHAVTRNTVRPKAVGERMWVF